MRTQELSTLSQGIELNFFGPWENLEPLRGVDATLGRNETLLFSQPLLLNSLFLCYS